MNSATKKEPGVLGTVTVTVGVVTAILSGVAIYVHATCVPCREEVSFAMIVLTAAGGVYAAYYIGQTLQVQVQMEEKKMRMQLQRDTFDLMNRFDSAKWTDIKHFIEEEIVDKSSTPIDIYKKVVSSQTLASSITEILGLFEDMCIAIESGYADERTLFDSMRFIVTHAYESLRPYIEHARSHYNHPSLFSKLQKLANEWGQKRMLSTGQTVNTKDADRDR